MKKYRVQLDLSASLDVVVEAESFEDAEKKISKAMYDEDEFIDSHRGEIYIWNPVIDMIEEEEEPNMARTNGDHEIIFTVKMPEKPGERSCEIVIGKRDTEFEPYVAWHCFDGESYTWGHYCQTIQGAMEEVIEKVRNEMNCGYTKANMYIDRVGKWLK